MRDFWYISPFLAGIALAGFFLYGIGQIIFADMEVYKVRYEQCITAGKQWIEGSCVK